MSGTSSYTQNFNSLSASASVSWSQGITVPSWYAHRSATTPPTALVVGKAIHTRRGAAKEATVVERRRHGNPLDGRGPW